MLLPFAPLMVGITRSRCQHARAHLHPYRRLCRKTYAVFEQQAKCTSLHQMRALMQQGKQLFHSVALMHVCQIGAGDSSCAMCADRDAYGCFRPQRDHPDPFPLLSNMLVGGPRMTPDYQQWLHDELHLYRKLCKLTHLVFETQGTCTTSKQMARLATDAMGLFDKTEEQRMPACLRGKCGAACALCMEHAAYGDVCPRRGM